MPERIHGIKMNTNNNSDLHYFGSHAETSSGFNTPTPPSAVPTYAASTTSKKYIVPPPRSRRYDNLNSTDGERPAVRDIETTKYMQMLLSLDRIPPIYNLLSSFFTWVLLAGYVLLPGTFTTIKEKGPEGRNDAERWILNTVKNAPLLWVAVFCTGLGALGMCGLWVRWRKNYVWLVGKIFLPGMLNSLAGMISTLINVLTAQKGVFSTTAIISITITATSTAINGGLWVWYNFFKLKKVQERHYGEYGYVKKPVLKFNEKKPAPNDIGMAV